MFARLKSCADFLKREMTERAGLQREMLAEPGWKDVERAETRRPGGVLRGLAKYSHS